jgi:hypothetical protein
LVEGRAPHPCRPDAATFFHTPSHPVSCLRPDSWIPRMSSLRHAFPSHAPDKTISNTVPPIQSLHRHVSHPPIAFRSSRLGPWPRTCQRARAHNLATHPDRSIGPLHHTSKLPTHGNLRPSPAPSTANHGRYQGFAPAHRAGGRSPSLWLSARGSAARFGLAAWGGGLYGRSVYECGA